MYIWKRKFYRILSYILLYFMTFIMLIPFIIALLNSFMGEHELYNNHYPNFHFIANEWDTLNELFENYLIVFKSTAGIDAFIDSLWIAIPTTILVTILSSLAAYPLSRIKLKRGGIILFAFLFASMVPTMAILIPIYLQFTKYGLYDSYLGIIIVLTAFILPFSIWIMKAFFDTVPPSLEDAASIDGCTRFGALVKIIMPLALPGIGAVGIYTFIASWSEFLIPLVLSRINVKVFTVYIGTFSNAQNVRLTLILAAGVISCLPVVILALLFQKIIIKGLIEGATKA
jgi:multiple sugar transport system permease protein